MECFELSLRSSNSTNSTHPFQAIIIRIEALSMYIADATTDSSWHASSSTDDTVDPGKIAYYVFISDLVFMGPMRCDA